MTAAGTIPKDDCPGRRILPTAPAGSFWQRNRLTILVLGAILLVGAIVRFTYPGQSPPGTTDDESGLLWNAYCMLRTGTDPHGEPCSIFYTRHFGEYRSTLFMYLLMPFQALLGLSVGSGRVGAAVLGLASMALVYLIGARMFGKVTGMVAAGVLVLNPWHVYYSRFPTESHPFTLTLAIAWVMLANLPFQDDRSRPPRPLISLLAGAACGLSCYGYASLRVFVPVFLAMAVVATWRSWRAALRTRKGILACLCLLLGSGITFGPLLWKHVVDGDKYMKRGARMKLWNPSANWGTNLESILARYPEHFDPTFLFDQGEYNKTLGLTKDIPGTGKFQWYCLPLMLVGLGVVFRRLRSSWAARVLLVWILLYPIGDLFYGHEGPHTYRSMPGLPALALLAAMGAVAIGRWLWDAKGNAPAHIAAAVVMCLSVIAVDVRFLHKLFVDYNTLPSYQWAFSTDLTEAYRYVKPRLKEVDAVYSLPSPYALVQAYAISLVAMEYEPRQWFRDARRFEYGYSGGDFDVCAQYGKMHFMYPGLWEKSYQELIDSGRRAVVYFIVRPGESRAPPEKVITNSQGTPTLWICRVRL